MIVKELRFEVEGDILYEFFIDEYEFSTLQLYFLVALL